MKIMITIMIKSKTGFITYTAIFLALLFAVQYITRPLGQYVTGSCVNFVLICAALLCGWKSGAIVAVVSPFLALFFGIGVPIIHVTGFVALGNLVLVLIYCAVFKALNAKPYLSWIISIATAAILKPAVLYAGIIKILPQIVPSIPPKQLAMLGAAFGSIQIVTAVFGGIAAFLIVPIVKKAISK